MAEGGGVFVGPVEPFENFSHADLGSLVAVLRNGAPHSVHAPGKRLVRGFGLPLWGDLQVVQIRTTPLIVHQTIQNVATTESPIPDGQPRYWEIPSLSLALSVQVNPDGDYRGFREHVRRFGASFGDALLDELAAGVEDVVRQRLAAYGHEHLYTASLPSVILPAKRQPLASGALVLVSLSLEAVTWSPWFMKERSGRAETDATTAIQLHRTMADEKVRVGQALSDASVRTVQTRAEEQVRLVQVQTDAAVRTAQVQADAAVLDAGLDGYEQVAERLGISAYDLLHPEQLQLRQDRAERLLRMLSEPGIRAYFQRDPGVLQAIVAQAMGSQRGSTIDRSAPRVGVDAHPVGALASEPLDLNRDPRLRRAVVRAVPALDRLTGVAAGSDGDGAVVLLVASEPIVDDVATTTLTGVLAPLLHADRIVVLVLVARTLDEVVARWFEALHPGAGLQVAVSVNDHDAVVIEVLGEVSPARAAVAELNRPGGIALEALADLLPHAAVYVRLSS